MNKLDKDLKQWKKIKNGTMIVFFPLIYKINCILNELNTIGVL